EIKDYSTRRGVIVPILPKIHKLLKENAEQDKLACIEPPEHLITWQHKMRRELVDINRRFLIAVDGPNVAGFFFYRYDGKKIYIEDFQVAWAYRNNANVIEGFLKKLEFDKGTTDAVFYASERVKIEANSEILASKGYDVKKTDDEGWEELGPLKQTAGALKMRYIRGGSV
ncbi:MAG: hypothetical protein LBI27_04230, partial [Clostridiales bacterium]|nr:hypothetical protein [Clostridiales bacterium]